jgi:hypothetical protein
MLSGFTLSGFESRDLQCQDLPCNYGFRRSLPIGIGILGVW